MAARVTRLTPGATSSALSFSLTATPLTRQPGPRGTRRPGQYVYAMCMLTTRLQILITPEQKRRLEAEATARGESVGGLVRAAIDERYGRRFTREERIHAVQEISAMPSAPFVSPEELSRMHTQEIEREHPELFPDESR